MGLHGGPGSPGCDTETGNVDVSSPLGGPATCAACATPADCSLDGTDPQCNDPVCNVGTCGVQSRPDGTTCDDGNACTGPDACQAGACVGPCVVGGSCTLSGGDPSSCILDGGTCGCAALASTTSTSTSSTTTSTTLPSGTDAVPIAFAGRNVVVGVGQLATLDGGGSFDPDGDALTFAWTVVKRPAGSTAALLSASTATPSLRPDVAGLYRIELIVTDGVLQGDPSPVDVTAMGVPPAISLTISDPVAGVTISADRVTVRGTIAGPANVGVSVNGVTAVVSGHVFAAADVPLTAGQNIVTATAAVPAGDVVATSIVVSSDGGASNGRTASRSHQWPCPAHGQLQL